MTTATMALGAVEIDQHIYTTDEVERLLWMHFSRQREVSVHGSGVRRYGPAEPMVCPRCLGSGKSKRRVRNRVPNCGTCGGRGKVAAIISGTSYDPSVRDELLTKADLIRAYRQLSPRLKAVVILFYGTTHSLGYMGRQLARHNGGVLVSERDVNVWRGQAVAQIVAFLNGGG